MKNQVNFWAWFFSQAAMPVMPPWDRPSLKISGPFPQGRVIGAGRGTVSGYISCSVFLPLWVPGPGVLYGALQRLQYSQSGFFPWAVTDLQVAQDHPLQPPQVPHDQDAKSADVKKH